MLAKITSKNQLTLPKSAVQALGAVEYFDVEVRAGQIVLTPVRIQRGDAVRAKLAALGLGEDDVADAVRWARAAGVFAVSVWPVSVSFRPTIAAMSPACSDVRSSCLSACTSYSRETRSVLPVTVLSTLSPARSRPR